MLTNQDRLKIALTLRAENSHKRQRTPPLNRQAPPSPKDRLREIEATAEQSYDQLTGEWHDWLEVARRYEHKVPYRDRLDIRHIIILELYRARQRDGEPIPELRAYRIASLTVALYWRKANRKPIMISLDQTTTDLEGNEVRLLDTVANDEAIEAIDAKIDASRWLLGCPMRLIEIAQKKIDGITLTKTDRQYLWRYLKRTQKTLIPV